MLQAMAEKKSKLGNMSFRIDEELRREFKLWCLYRNREMTDVIVKGIRATMDAEPLPAAVLKSMKSGK